MNEIIPTHILSYVFTPHMCIVLYIICVMYCCEVDWFWVFLQNGTGGVEKAVYKRVAVVEFFFDIIYRVHVETEAKNGKHAGQKRTYRAVSDILVTFISISVQRAVCIVGEVVRRL